MEENNRGEREEFSCLARLLNSGAQSNKAFIYDVERSICGSVGNKLREYQVTTCYLICRPPILVSGISKGGVIHFALILGDDSVRDAKVVTMLNLRNIKRLERPVAKSFGGGSEFGGTVLSEL
jgi:hypothetical protein